MNFIEYSPLALRTAKPLPHPRQVFHAVLGLVTEVGELADCIKKSTIYGKDLDKVNLMEEIADLLWYLNLFMVEMGIGGRIVDLAVSEFDQIKPSNTAVLESTVLALAGLAGALAIEARERGTGDVEAVKIFAGLLAVLLTVSGYTLSQALEHNINKLALRYGDKYSDYKALNRDTAAERAVLEV